MNLFAAASAVVESAPAAGAEIKQIAIGGVVISIWMTFMLVLGLRHRAGSTDLLDRADAAIEQRTGLPGWAVLPYGIVVSALAIAGVGFVWDVSLHLDDGRDPGPFANPSHYMLIVGMVLSVTAGWLAIVMPKGRAAGPAAVRIAHDWYVPAGGVAMLACGTLSLSGFAADDVWHRLFGQDVTLWGPTHLMMISGGLLVLFSSFVLMREGMRTKRAPRSREEKRAAAASGETKGPVALLSTALLLGGALTGLTIAYQQEFSYGFPQFRLLFHPILIAFSAGVVLTAARTLYGRGGALVACAGTLLINVFLTLLVSYGFGEVTLHFPLYIAAALLVELAAVIALKKGRYWFAGLSAVLIGSLGTLAEYAWSNVWMPLPWPAHILPAAIATGIVAAACGAVLGTFFGTTLTARPGSRLLGRSAAWTPLGAVAVFAVLVTVLIPQHAPAGLTASVKLTEVSAAPGRTVSATITYSDRSFGDNADWVQAFAWQGDGLATTAPMRKLGPGVWTTTEPLPVDGTWKSALRVHRGDVMGAVPVHMPADAALKLPATPASAEFTRAVVMDRKLMQRERRADVPGYFFALGSTIVALMTVLLVVVLGWALLRVARGGPLTRIAQTAGDAVDGQEAEAAKELILGPPGGPQLA
ncbi:MAG: hypothetical protein ACSLFF_08360 [Solirubrobacterales bacterium]